MNGEIGGRFRRGADRDDDRAADMDCSPPVRWLRWFTGLKLVAGANARRRHGAGIVDLHEGIWRWLRGQDLNL